MKPRTLFGLLVVLSLIATPGFSKDKNRDWQTGKLVSIVEGSTEHTGMLTGSQTSVVGVSSECKTWLYTVETDSMTYVFSAHTGAWCANHPNLFTVGAPVRFALGQKAKAFLIDEDGKEFKADLITKTPRKQTQ